MANMNLRQQRNRVFDKAFTLIELLAVIAIIGIITGMIVQLAPAVNQRKKRERVDVEKNNLMALIDNYKAKFGHYPPDNPNLTLPANLPLTPQAYDKYTQVNTLLYELAGGSNNTSLSGPPGQLFIAFNGSNFNQSEISGAFGVQGILNADQEMQVIYKPLPAPSAYQNYPSWLVGQFTKVQGLTVPVDMVQINDPKNASSLSTPTSANFWHYDASSTNRHNPNGYDLWAEFVLAKTKTGWAYWTNGNWGQ